MVRAPGDDASCGKASLSEGFRFEYRQKLCESKMNALNTGSRDFGERFNRQSAHIEHHTVPTDREDTHDPSLSREPLDPFMVGVALGKLPREVIPV